MESCKQIQSTQNSFTMSKVLSVWEFKHTQSPVTRTGHQVISPWLVLVSDQEWLGGLAATPNDPH